MIVSNFSGEQTVTLTDTEAEAAGEFDELINMGETAVEAMEHIRGSYPTLTDEFIDWLGC